MTELTDLIKKIQTDENVKTQFKKALKENTIVEFCKDNGVETTKEEIALIALASIFSFSIACMAVSVSSAPDNESSCF